MNVIEVVEVACMLKTRQVESQVLRSPTNSLSICTSLQSFTSQGSSWTEQLNRHNKDSVNPFLQVHLESSRMVKHEEMHCTLQLLSETPITLAQVPNYIPKRNGRKIHYSTVFRWVTKGARGRVLKSTLVGGIRYTSVEALERFLGSAPSTPALGADFPLSEIEEALDQIGL